MAWTRVEIDSGVPTVIVSDEHMTNFPKFMNHILREKIGMEEGFFKVSGLVSQTKLADLCAFAKEYFSKLKRPESLQEKEENREAYPVQQLFFCGSHSEHLYGIQQKICSSSQFASFASKASQPETFKASSCCESALNESVAALEDHYWAAIGCISEKSSALGKSFTKFTVNSLLHKAEVFRKSLYPYSEESYPNIERVSSVSLRRMQKKSNQNAILYCPGIPLDKKEFPVSATFSLSKLGTLLDCHPEKYPGLAYPYLYIASKHSSFAWHVEGKALFSINVLHFGAPCVWFFASPKHFKKFSEVARTFPLDPGQVSCGFVLIHKYLKVCRALLAKHGIPVQVVIQKENEIIITYPFASHAGFKMGWNFSQAANFADPWWVEPALFVPPCVCWPNQINMDIKEMLAVVRPDLLIMYMRRDYLNLAVAVRDNEFLKLLDILPSVTIPKDIRECAIQDMEVDTAKEEEEPRSEQSTSCGFKGARYILQCPKQGCLKTLEGGRTHLPRMVAHIGKKHPNEPELVKKLHQMNPARSLKSHCLVCPVCGEKRAGNKFHLQQHIKKKHSTS